MLGPQTTAPSPTHPQGPGGPGREKRPSLPLACLLWSAMPLRVKLRVSVLLLCTALRVFLAAQLLTKASQAEITTNMGCSKKFYGGCSGGGSPFKQRRTCYMRLRYLLFLFDGKCGWLLKHAVWLQ